MIIIENLTKKFGEVTAVEGLSLQVEEGEIFGFLGPNGAGKTTSIRMLCCLISKTSGDARIDDYEISKPADSLQIRKMIGLARTPADYDSFSLLSKTLLVVNFIMAYLSLYHLK